MRTVCVFCGSSAGRSPAYLAAARLLGETIAHRHLRLVYGGSHVGLMGAVADAALASGGEVIGVIPSALQSRELAHRGLTRLEVVSSMHERKARMAELSDGFIALPGGMGTLEELTEILTWAQLGLHRKPCGLLEVGSYWAPFVAFLDHAVVEGFVHQEHREHVKVGVTPDALLDALERHRPPAVPAWIAPDER